MKKAYGALGLTRTWEISSKAMESSSERHGKNEAIRKRCGRPRKLAKACCGCQVPTLVQMAKAVSNKYYMLQLQMK